MNYPVSLRNIASLLLAFILVAATSCSPVRQQDPVQRVLAQQGATNNAAEAQINSLEKKCKGDCAAYSADPKNVLHFKSCSDWVRASQAGLEDTVAKRQCADDVWQAQESCREYDKAVNDFKALIGTEKEDLDSLAVRP